jgi:hypothetical protein
MKLMVKVGTA